LKLHILLNEQSHIPCILRRHAGASLKQAY